MLRSAQCLALLASILTGCVWTSDGGFTERYVSDWEGTVQSEPGSWAGEPIVIAGNGGQVTIVGVEGRTNISLTARFSAGARSQADAEAAFVDVHESLSIELRDGAWLVECNEARETHGSAVPSATGCAAMVLEIPAGSEIQPLSLRAWTSFGGIHASGIVVEELDLEAPMGLVADVVPTDDSTLRLWGGDLVSGMCSSWLRVPEDTGFGSIELTVAGAESDYVGDDPDDPEFWLEVGIRGFDDAPTLPSRTGHTTWSRDTDGPFVESAIVRADLGKAIVTTDAVPDADGATLCASWELGEGWGTPE
jgi:hypothetical protein